MRYQKFYHPLPSRGYKVNKFNYLFTIFTKKYLLFLDADKLLIDGKEIHFEPYEDYLNDCRININIRQVLNSGQMSLEF